MDYNTLWFIANGLARQGGPPGLRPHKSGPPQGVPPSPCYKCGEGHWIRDCPYAKKDQPTVPALPPLTRFCIDCGIKHLVQDCPANPEVKGKSPVTLNMITMIPSTGSPSSSESDVVVPIKVITRAQAKANEEKTEATPSEKSKKSKRESWKARRERRAASQRRQKENNQKETNAVSKPTHNEEMELGRDKNQGNETIKDIGRVRACKETHGNLGCDVASI